MKTSVRLLILSTAFAAGAQAAPFLAVSDNSEVFLTATAGVRQDSNIYLARKAVSDTVWDLDPGLQYVFGNTSAAKGTLNVGENLTAYSSHSNLNSNLLNSSFNIGYEDGKTKASFDAGYVELNQNTFNVNNSTNVKSDQLIRRDLTNFDAVGEVAVTEKTSLGAGVDFQRTNYRTVGFSDQDLLSFPINYYYELTPKLDASVGYRYRVMWQQSWVDAVDNFYNVGLRGEITPKLTGHINVGATDRRFTGKLAHKYNLGSLSLFGVESDLTYAVSPKATLQLSVNNDFDTNAQGQQEKDLSITGGSSIVLTEQWSLNGSVTWRQLHYTNNFDFSNLAHPVATDRTDEFWDLEGGVTYKINAIVNVTASVAYRDNASGRAVNETNGAGRSLRSFEQTVWSLAANFRY